MSSEATAIHTFCPPATSLTTLRDHSHRDRAANAASPTATITRLRILPPAAPSGRKGAESRGKPLAMVADGGDGMQGLRRRGTSDRNGGGAEAPAAFRGGKKKGAAALADGG